MDFSIRASFKEFYAHLVQTFDGWVALALAAHFLVHAAAFDANLGGYLLLAAAELWIFIWFRAHEDEAGFVNWRGLAGVVLAFALALLLGY